MTRYDHGAIEPKWQEFWEKNHSFKADTGSDKPKYYVLDMFPYPSGAGLHVGHGVGYTATDIVARFKRAHGFNVLHPMGWDSFGLPAEQYAIRTGTHPRITTQENIATYKRQLKSFGFGYDWDREVATSDPNFYKWTQWIFTKLFEKGLAYEADILVNFCPALGTVLANEEVEDGKSKDGGHPVVRKPLKQWVLRITAYADRLLEDLKLVDWPEPIRRLQKHWIGRSEGALIRFQVDGGGEIEVFTTRHDTLFGTSYLVLSPEHPLVDEVTTPEHRNAILEYRAESAKKSDLDRTELAKEKTGVFTGGYATNPVNGEKLPIWIADYVLMGYGTGAVMGVPYGDERDFEFSKKYHLPIPPVVLPPGASEPPEFYVGPGTLINSGFLDGLDVPAAKQAMVEWLEKNKAGEARVNYRMRDWLFSRQRYWGEPFPILHFTDGSKRALEPDELPLTPPELEDFHPTEDGLSPIAKVPEWVKITDPKTGQPAQRETNTMPQWAGSCWYYLRFCDPHNSHEPFSAAAEQYWLPVDLYIGGAEHAVLHLLYARFWHKVLYDIGAVSSPEPFGRLFNQGLINARSYRIPGGNYVAPHLAEERDERYFHKETGEELISGVEKMSKSKLNVINPDDMIEEYGADALRLYEMFMGPLDKDKIWETSGVSGCRRFLSRFWDLAQKASDDTSEEALRLGHRVVHGVTRDIEKLHFNTAIAKLMEFVNDFSRLETHSREVLRMVTQALAPLAPHIGEELWQQLGGEGSVLDAPWPQIESRYLQDATITYVVQVNGKVRGRFELPKDADKETIVSLAQQDEGVQRHLTGEVRKVIFIPNKLLNLVVGGPS
jgi:leucyl-tRNA synthetase